MTRSALLFALLGSTALATPPTTAPNFALLDHEGRFHELDYYRRGDDVKGFLLFIHGVGCPQAQKRVPDLKQLRAQYEPKGIAFAMLNANSQDSREEVAKEAREFGVEIPILLDPNQLVARELGLTRTAEALLISAKDKKIVYRGAIDDRLTYQQERPEATQKPLAKALDAFLAGEPIAEPVTEAPGCKITFADATKTTAGAEIGYREVIAPILLGHCVRCHTEGGLGPFAMSDHGKVKGWADMMKEVILAKQMPPWQADPHVGKFANANALSEEEARVLVAWIDAGCPRGEGDDPLAAHRPSLPEWELGQPDHVISLPTQDIPEKGILPYRYVEVDSPWPDEAWIRAVQVKAGNTRVLHHVIVNSVKESKERSLAGYAPGMSAQTAPPETAIKISKGAKIRFQLHYTTSGKPEQDATRLGLWLANYPVKKEFKTDVLIEHKFLIPPGASEHPAEKTRAIKKDVLVYSMNPHMHFRGKRMSYEATLPDGTVKPLLSVPNYHFNWQRDYYFQEPVFLPKGSKLTVKAAWDNSAKNAFNPDPGKAVHWGEQSFDEMFFASYKYVEVDERK